MEKAMTSDLIGTLRGIMEAHTGFCLPDFDDDAEDLSNAAMAAGSAAPEDRTFLWSVCACGTWCLLERNVFTQGSWEHFVWTCHAGQSGKGTLAYRIEVSGMKNGKIAGSIRRLDYGKHRQFAKDMAACAL